MKTQTVIILTALAALVVALISGSLFAYYAIVQQTPSTANPTEYGSSGAYQNMMGNYGGMGNMMGSIPTTPTPSIPPASQNPATAQSTVFPTVSIAYLAIGAAAIFGASGLVYLIKYPRGQVATPKPLANGNLGEPTLTAAAPYDTVSKTLTPEERQVLNVLSAHNGKYLQKYIRSETGLSRLKTHRIVSRLAERGIVTTEKNGNTNEVVLSGWLHQSKTQTAA